MLHLLRLFVRARGRRYLRATAVVGLLLGLTASTAHGAQSPDNADIHVVAVGDIMLGGTAAPELARFGYDYPFMRVRDLLHGDVVFGNLEGPLTNRGTAAVKEYVFHSPPRLVAPALARAGFNVVSLANNHTMDYGLDGLRDTVAALQQAGISHVGAGKNLGAARRPAFIQVGATRVAVLAYSLTFPEEFWANSVRPGTAFGHERQIRADVAAARKSADVVLVSFHWGRERTIEPRAYQRQLGHAAIDAGAAAVIGHHPHVLQGIERYRDGVILYSLGNFVFGSYSRAATRSVVAKLLLQRGHVRLLELYPIDVFNVEVVFQPVPLRGPSADDVVMELQRISQPLGTFVENRDGVAVVTFPANAN